MCMHECKLDCMVYNEDVRVCHHAWIQYIICAMFVMQPVSCNVYLTIFLSDHRCLSRECVDEHSAHSLDCLSNKASVKTLRNIYIVALSVCLTSLRAQRQKVHDHAHSLKSFKSVPIQMLTFWDGDWGSCDCGKHQSVQCLHKQKCSVLQCLFNHPIHFDACLYRKIP